MDGFQMIQAHYMYCALYFYYYYINSTSGHQALDPEDPYFMAWAFLRATVLLTMGIQSFFFPKESWILSFMMMIIIGNYKNKHVYGTYLLSVVHVFYPEIIV